MTNTGQMVVLPKLLNRLSQIAPNVRIEVRDLDEDTPRKLESGEAALAMGFTLNLQAGFHQQKLFTEHYVCLMRAGHPRIQRKLTRAQLVNEKHVAVMTSGTAHWMLDKAIEDAGVSRQVALWVPSFLALEEIIAKTDFIALAPIHLAELIAAHGSIKFLDVPIDLPSYLVRQYWHDRYHKDAACRWLRSVVVDLFRD